MKKIFLISLTILIVFSIGLLLLLSKEKPNYRIVRLTGGSSYGNYSSYSFCTDFNDGRPSSLILADGEIIIIFMEDFFAYIIILLIRAIAFISGKTTINYLLMEN